MLEIDGRDTLFMIYLFAINLRFESVQEGFTVASLPSLPQDFWAPQGWGAPLLLPSTWKETLF